MDWMPVFFIGLSVGWYVLRAQELFAKPSPSRLQRLLGYIFLWWAVSTLKDLMLYIPGIHMAEELSHVFFVDGCGAVTFAILLFELTMPGWVTWPRTIPLLLPFAAFFGLHLCVDSPWIERAFTFYFVLFAWTAVVIAVVKGRSYARYIRQNYSDLDDVDISWIWTIIVFFIISQHVWLAVAEKSDAIVDSFYYLSSLVCWHFTLRGVNRLHPVCCSPAINTPPSRNLLQQMCPLMTPMSVI